MPAAIRSSSRCCCAPCMPAKPSSNGTQRLEALPTSAFRQMPLPAADKIIVPNREQSNTTVIVDRLLRGEDFPQDQRRHSSRDRDRPVPDRAYRLPATSPISWARSNWSKATSGARSPSRIGSSRTRATPGRSPAPISAASSTTSACCRPRPSPRKARSLRPICSRSGRSAAAPASCRARWRAGPTLPDFAPEPIGARGHRGLDRAPGRAQRPHLRSPGRASASGLAEADQALADRILAARAAITEHIRHLLPATIDAVKVRHHGDFHLGQVLIAKDDAYHPRLRGRAGPLARRAARQGAGRARRRRAASARSTIRPPRRCSTRSASRPRSATSSFRSWRSGARRPPRSSGPPAGRRPTRRCGPPIPPRRRTCSISSCSKRRSTKWNTN